MTAPESDAGWVELVNWVRWLHDVYELSVEERLPQCWPQHPGLVEELRALKTWREEIYRAQSRPACEPDHQETWQSTSAQPTPGPATATGTGQAARYWHAELRQVLHAAGTQYAPGCPAGHRVATLLDDVNASLHTRWLAGDGETRIPAPLLSSPNPHTGRKEISSMTTIEASVLRAALEHGQAQPIADLVQDYIHYDGSWWTPLAPAAPSTPPAQGRGSAPSATVSAGLRSRDLVSLEATSLLWQRIPEGDFSDSLDASAPRLRAADDAVQAQRPRNRAPQNTKQE